MNDVPEVWIDEQLIAGTFTKADLAVLAHLSWTWGRSSIYDETSAAQLSLELLDPNGEFAASTLTGRIIRIKRGDGRNVFRGRINDQEAEPVELTPGNGTPFKVWRVSLTASDGIAEAGQAVLPGPGTDAPGVAQFGPTYWPTQSPAARIAALNAAMDSELILNGILWDNPYPTGAYWPLARYREFADQQSVLDMLEALYSAIPLAHVQYDSHSRQLRPGQPAVADGLALVWNGTTLELDLPGGVEVPARDVVLPAGRKAVTSMDAGLDVVQVTVPNYGPSTDYEIVDATTERETARFAPAALGRKALALRTDIYYNDPAIHPAGACWQKLLAEDVRDLVDDINGMLSLPPIRFHFGLRDYPDDVANLAINSRTWPEPIYFPGSIFNPLQASGASHQIIGGTVTWNGKHWLADCTLAPAVGQGAALRWNQLVTIDAPEWRDFDDDITFADLGNVTTGVNA